MRVFGLRAGRAPVRFHAELEHERAAARREVLDPQRPLRQVDQRARERQAEAVHRRARGVASVWREDVDAFAAAAAARPATAMRKRMPASVSAISIASSLCAADRRSAAIPRFRIARRDQLAIAVQRPFAVGRRARHRDVALGHRRQPPQRLDRLRGRLAQAEALVARDELTGLDAVVVEHGADGRLDLLEDAARVLDARLEVGKTRVAGSGANRSRYSTLAARAPICPLRSCRKCDSHCRRSTISLRWVRCSRSMRRYSARVRSSAQMRARRSSTSVFGAKTASAPAASARTLSRRRSFSVYRIVGTKCVRTLAFNRTTSRSPRKAGRDRR